MSYAIISVGGKQYRVTEGEKLLVDRLRVDEGATFTPRVLFSGGDGDARLAPEDVTVTARVVGHVLGEKIRIGKYRPKSGYRRHTGYRSRLSRIEIESIGGGEREGSPTRATAPPAQEEAPAPSQQDSPAAVQEPTAPAPADPLAEALPGGYAKMTAAGVAEGVGTWDRRALEAALDYERARGARKSAIAALEAALAEKEEEE